MSTETIQIAIIDDHPMMREGVIHIFNNEADFEVVGEGENARDAIRIAQDRLPDIMLLDISMPGNGITAAQTISTSCPVIKIVMLTVSEDEKHVSVALRAGARGYILKGVSGPELVRSVRAIHHGESYVSPGLAARLLGELKPTANSKNNIDMQSKLTIREEQILALLSEGLSNREIGEKLDLSEKTIKHYMTNIFQKLHVRNRVEAALIAQNGKRTD